MNKQRELYYKFLDLEIPNFIQILAGLSLVSFLLNNIYFSIPIIILGITYLFDRYLLAKFFEFAKDQVCDPHSDMNREKIDVNEFRLHFKKVVPLTSAIFLIISVLLAVSIKFFSV